MSVFPEKTAWYLGVIDELISGLSKPTYEFMDIPEYVALQGRDLAEANRVYWTEMLARVHLCSIAALKRSRRWIAGAETAASTSNLLLFAAAMRGFIESAADATTSLARVPEELAINNASIRIAVTGKMSLGTMAAQPLEDALIHFQYGRKLPKSHQAPESHSALQVREYLSALERANIGGLLDTYSWLCDLTHPGAGSVWMWLGAKSEYELFASEDQDAAIISAFVGERSDLIRDVLFYAFNMPVLSLAVLNYFPSSEFHTPSLANWDLSGIAYWRKIRSNFLGVPIFGRQNQTASEPKLERGSTK